MPKKTNTKYLDKINPNDFEWDLSKIDGDTFESEIQNIIEFEVNRSRLKLNQYCRCAAKRTPKGGDGGKDMVLRFDHTLEILGHKLFVPRDKKIGLASVEIKKTDISTLSAQVIAGSIFQLTSDGKYPNYLILITNATLTPDILNLAKESVLQKNCQLIFIDGIRLARQIINFVDIKHNLPLPNETLLDVPDISISYSISDILHDEGDLDIFEKPKDISKLKSVHLNLAMHNFSLERKIISLSLRSDVNWNLEEVHEKDCNFELDTSENIFYFVDPLGFETIKLRLEQKSLDAIDELRIGLTIDGSSRSIVIDSRKISFEFDPIMFGDGYVLQVNNFVKSIREKSRPNFIRLHGCAGVGKSKIVSEIRNRLADAGFEIAMTTLRKGSDLIDTSNFSDVFKSFDQWSAKIAPEGFFKKIAKIAENQWKTLLIVIEDLHDGNKNFFTALENFYKENQRCENIIILTTGRDDGTVVNDNYISFFAKILSLNNVYSINFSDIKVEPWSDAECESFIRLTIEDVPTGIVKKIRKLSQNTPFGIIQAIRYLLDLEMVEVRNRNTVSVINGEKISGKNFLPSNISRLISARTEYLNSKTEDLAEVILTTMSFFGMEIDVELLEKIFCNEEELEVIKLMVKSQLIIQENEKYLFAHENFQIYFRRNLRVESRNRKDSVSLPAATAILKCSDAMAKISNNDVYYLNFFIKRYKKTFDGLSYIYKKTEHENNISSIDIEKSEYQYIRPLIIASKKINFNHEKIAELCCIEAYLALHNLPLALALISCEELELIILKLSMDVSIKKLAHLKIQQLRAHIMLNMGYVQAAQKLMLEISANVSIDVELKKNYQILFEVFDRLQNIYHQLNHKKLFIYYSDASLEIAEANNDKQLMSLAKASRSKEFFYDDPMRYLNLTRSATCYSREKASNRHKFHGEVNLCIAELLCAEGDTNLLKEILVRLLDFLPQITKNEYAFQITRVQLAIAVTYALLGLGCKVNRTLARVYVDSAMESAIGYGNGFFFWQLHNAKAIIELNEDEDRSIFAFKNFETAIFYLRKQGLLFLGNIDSCSPNLSVISNYIKFLDSNFVDSKKYTFLKSLSYYDKGISDEKKEITFLLETVRNFGLIGRKKILEKSLIDKNTGYLFALR